MISGIKERFDQPGYKLYEQLEDLLVRSIKGENYDECLSAVTAFYTTDLGSTCLQVSY